MDRNLWRLPIVGTHFPSWPCPRCRSGILIARPNALTTKETFSSRAARADSDWSPEWIEERAVGFLSCSATTCREAVAFVGICSYAEFDLNEVTRIIRPLVLEPMPDVFKIDEKWPAPVKAALRESFKLFWRERAAASNCIRVAVEALLDRYRIPRYSLSKKRKQIRLSLATRIAKFKLRQPTEADQLSAIRLLGNKGSHSFDVDGEDVLDAFEIVEGILAELLSRRSMRLRKLAKSLHARHK